MRNKILIIALLVIVTTGMSIAGISAYFISHDAADNPTDVGNNEIALHEDFKNPDIKPGQITTITKKVDVENTGENPAAIRVRVEFSDSSLLAENGGKVTVDYNTTDWQKNGDYWYLKTPLAPGESTDDGHQLFNKVTVTNPTDDEVRDFDVYVYAESRNCESNTAVSAMPALFSENTPPDYGN